MKLLMEWPQWEHSSSKNLLSIELSSNVGIKHSLSSWVIKALSPTVRHRPHNTSDDRRKKLEISWAIKKV